MTFFLSIRTTSFKLFLRYLVEAVIVVMIKNIGTWCTWNNKSKDSKRIKNQSPCFCGIKDVSMFTKDIRRRLEDKLLVWQSFLSTFQRRKSNSNSFVEMEVAITKEKKYDLLHWWKCLSVPLLCCPIRFNLRRRI